MILYRLAYDDLKPNVKLHYDLKCQHIRLRLDDVIKIEMPASMISKKVMCRIPCWRKYLRESEGTTQQ